MLTLKELKERLAQELDEITVLEKLQITTATLLDRFEDIIEENYDAFLALVEVEEEEQEEEDT